MVEKMFKETEEVYPLKIKDAKPWVCR